MGRESRNLVVFFVATFVWTWALYIPIVISGHSPYEMPWMIMLVFGGAGPSIVGVSLVLLTCDREQRRDYWRRCFSLRRISLMWWLVILLIFPTILAVSVSADLVRGGSMPGMGQLASLMANPLMWPLAAFISFMSGPWSEEFGWRGYALDRIIQPFGVIPGAIGLGVIWGVWHLPLYFMPATWHGEMGFKLAGFWAFIVLNIGMSLIMVWVYKNTNRSILSGMLLHFASNFTAQLVAPISDEAEAIHTVLILGVGTAGCVLMERRTRARELALAED